MLGTDRAAPFVMMLRCLAKLLPLALAVSTAVAAVPWHDSLCLANDGYWPRRVVATVHNESGQSAVGVPVSLRVPGLRGERVESIRVCRADGVELLYDVRNPNGLPKRQGALEADDVLTIPVECAAGQTCTLVIYVGNEVAWPVPDFLEPKSAVLDTRLSLALGEVERLSLTLGPAVTARSGGGAWVEVRARNLRDEAVRAALVRVNLTPVFTRLAGRIFAAAPKVFSADGSELDSYALGQGRELLFPAELPARSQQRFRVELRPLAKGKPLVPQEDYARLLRSASNLIPNGDFEVAGADLPGWTRSEALGAGGVGQTVVTGDARFGGHALDLKVDNNASAAWVGWRSQEIPVRPGATYLLGGWLKAIGLGSAAMVHAHFHDRSGALTRSGAMVGTQPSVAGTSEWVNTMATVQAPADAATLQVHLTMNTTGVLRHDGLLLCEVLDGSLGQMDAGTAQASTSRLQVWQVNPLVKVFPDTPAQRSVREVSVELARNEYEPFQLAIRTEQTDLHSLQISVSSLRGPDGASLPPVKVERVGFVPVDHPSGYYTTSVPEWCRRVPQGAGATDGWAGWWPDPLAPGERVSLTPGKTQPMWFTVHAPGGSAAGAYRGQVEIACEGRPVLRLPLRVRVLPFTLPQTTHLRAIFDLRFGPGGGFGSGAETSGQRRGWLRFLAEHRLGIDAIRPEPRFSYADGQVTMDASAFDEVARVCFDELGMGVCYTPQFFYQFGWAYPPKKFFGLEPFTPEWTGAFKQAYRLFVDHLRDKGWHDKFVYYISDEPHFQHDFVVAQMQRLCALIHEVDPNLPVYSSTWRYCPAWAESLDVWGVGQYGCFPAEELARLRALGKRFWFTCDGQMATDTPFLATERMLPYYAFNYGAEGFEFWGSAWWTYDPWQVGWHQFIRQSDEGKRYYWIRYPNGDGFLAYPGKAVGMDGPASTIRLEQVREGLEDYEALLQLSERVVAARRAGEPFMAGERALDMARALVTIPNAGGLRSSEILTDPDRIPRIRRAVNEALVESPQPRRFRRVR